MMEFTPVKVRVHSEVLQDAPLEGGFGNITLNKVIKTREGQDTILGYTVVVPGVEVFQYMRYRDAVRKFTKVSQMRVSERLS